MVVDRYNAASRHQISKKVQNYLLITEEFHECFSPMVTRQYMTKTLYFWATQKHVLSFLVDTALTNFMLGIELLLMVCTTFTVSGAFGTLAVAPIFWRMPEKWLCL